MALYLGTDKVSVGNAYNIDTLLDRAVYVGSPEEPIEEQSLVADKLAVPRKIGNVEFDGSKDITGSEIGIPNPNLLDNSDFINVVNQRGQTSYDNAYTIDRWTLGVNDPIVEVVFGEGVKLSNGDPTYGTLFIQKVNPVSVSESRGNYTFSVGDNEGNVYSVTGKFTENSEKVTPWGKLLLTTYDLNPSVQIGVNSGQEKTFAWAKLELGDVATPWQPKGYGVELLECMRYYQKINMYVSTTVNQDVQYPERIPVPLMSPMRDTPIVSVQKKYGPDATAIAIGTTGISLVFAVSSGTYVDGQYTVFLSADL